MNSTTHETRSSTRQRRATWKIREQDEFIPIVVEPLPTVTKPILSDPIPQFEPESRVPFDSIYPVISYTNPLCLFLGLFSEQTLAVIVATTNIYTNFFTQKLYPYRPRPWHDLTRNELL